MNAEDVWGGGGVTLEQSNSNLKSQVYSLPDGATAVSNGSNGIPSGLGATMPTFSNGGDHVAFNFYFGSFKIGGKTYTADKKSLAQLDFAKATPLSSSQFSNFKTIVTPGTTTNVPTGTAVWPSYFPTNVANPNRIVFELETRTNSRDFGGTRGDSDSTASTSKNGAQGQLYWVDVSGSTPSAARLSRLNGLNGTTSYLATGSNAHDDDTVLNFEPTVNPQAVGGYVWVVFTSRRLYGNIATLNPYHSDPRYYDLVNNVNPKKLWVAALDPTAASGTDPSKPAFYLPGQELASGNMRAYWVLDACKNPGTTSASLCSSDLECCGGTASPQTAACIIDDVASPSIRHCQAMTPYACVDAGAACLTDANCCGVPEYLCIAQKCTAIPAVEMFSPATFTRDFEAVCSESGTLPVWRSFEWLSTTPVGSPASCGTPSSPRSNIPVLASTSDDATFPASSTGTVNLVTIASASGNSDPAIWHLSPDIETLMRASGYTSMRYLRINVTLNPTCDKMQSPRLVEWRATYSCEPAK